MGSLFDGEIACPYLGPLMYEELDNITQKSSNWYIKPVTCTITMPCTMGKYQMHKTGSFDPGNLLVYILPRFIERKTF